MPFNLFGKSEAKVDPMEAITKLNDSTEMLEKKSAHLEKQIEKELQSAKTYGTKNKRMALGALKRKKRFEAQLNSIDNTITTIEFQKESLMNARANAEMLKTMQMAGKAMQSIHKEVGGVDKVDDIMADIEESNMIAGEIGDAISRPMNIGQDDFDDEDLLAELEDLEQEEFDTQVISVGQTPTAQLPSVPTNRLPAVQKQTKEDQDLEDLNSWIMN